MSVVVGWSDEARVLAVGRQARQTLDDELGTMARWDDAGYEPGKVPGVISELSARLEQRWPAKKITVTGGPCFTFPDQAGSNLSDPLPLIVSDPAGRERASQLGRPGNWRPREWAGLIDGNLGSWAFAVDGSSVVSICHTPAANHEASEAGVWTREDYRGRGLAPSVVRAWWSWEGQFKDALFYSTTGDNHASRAVARKLGLKPLGWLWVAQ